MMNAFATSATTPQVVEQKLGMKPEEFDRQFLAWLDGQTKKTVSGFGEWRNRLRAMAQAFEAKKYDVVIADGNAIRDVYPDYVEHGQRVRAAGRGLCWRRAIQAAARSNWRRSPNKGGRMPGVLKKLATMQEEAGDKRAAAGDARPAELHLPAGRGSCTGGWASCISALGNVAGAVRECEAVVNGTPVDPAAAHFELARAYKAGGQQGEGEGSKCCWRWRPLRASNQRSDYCWNWTGRTN